MKSCSRRVNRITEQYTTVLRFVIWAQKLVLVVVLDKIPGLLRR
jgi:hypothetical protein